MESWIDIQREITEAGKPKGLPGDVDTVRRDAYKKLAALTGRPLIIYASAFHVPWKAQIAAQMLSIDLSDKEGFREVVRNLEGPKVDVFVHSPGGSPEATESVVSILRSKFDDIRFIVTGTAKSAATMLVMSGNRILMTSDSELGPTDPQEFVGGARPAPAGAILDQFELGKKEVAKNPSLMGGWLPILQQYGPSLLVECDNHIKLAERLVAGWLKAYMFKSDKNPESKANKLAKYLATDKNFLSHGRRVDIDMLIDQGAVVDRVEDLPEETARAISRVHLAIMATLDATTAVKIFENSEDAVLIRMMEARVGPMQPSQPPQQPPQPDQPQS